MRTARIEWTEVSTHRATVNVPTDFDPERADLADALAELDGFVGVEREAISVTFLDTLDVTVEAFTPSSWTRARTASSPSVSMPPLPSPTDTPSRSRPTPDSNSTTSSP